VGSAPDQGPGMAIPLTFRISCGICALRPYGDSGPVFAFDALGAVLPRGQGATWGALRYDSSPKWLPVIRQQARSSRPMLNPLSNRRHHLDCCQLRESIAQLETDGSSAR